MTLTQVFVVRTCSAKFYLGEFGGQLRRSKFTPRYEKCFFGNGSASVSDVFYWSTVRRDVLLFVCRVFSLAKVVEWGLSSFKLCRQGIMEFIYTDMRDLWSRWTTAVAKSTTSSKNVYFYWPATRQVRAGLAIDSAAALSVMRSIVDSGAVTIIHTRPPQSLNLFRTHSRCLIYVDN